MILGDGICMVVNGCSTSLLPTRLRQLHGIIQWYSYFLTSFSAQSWLSSSYGTKPMYSPKKKKRLNFIFRSYELHVNIFSTFFGRFYGKYSFWTYRYTYICASWNVQNVYLLLYTNFQMRHLLSHVYLFYSAVKGHCLKRLEKLWLIYGVKIAIRYINNVWILKFSLDFASCTVLYMHT